MADLYTECLGASITYGNDVISFVTYDEEHHRIALVGFPSAAPKNPSSCGLEHIAITYASLAELLLAYRHRKARGILPARCVTTDPNGNMLETQVDNFDTVDKATAFMMSDNFAENPIGVDFDAEKLIAALQSGEDERMLKTR